MMRVFDYTRIQRHFERRYLEDRGYGSGREFTAQLVGSVRPGDVLLDLGCGEGTLRHDLPPTVHYVGLDRYAGLQTNEYSDWTMRPSVVGDVHYLPFADASCASVALLHVLEHVSAPGKVFAEIARVLRPGGGLFVDVPFLHEIHHAPHDHFRYTPYALEALAQGAGLDVMEIRPSGGYFRNVAHLLEAAPTVIQGDTMSPLLIRALVARPLQGLGWIIRKLQYVLDLYDRDQRFTCGYHCVFKKPLIR